MTPRPATGSTATPRRFARPPVARLVTPSGVAVEAVVADRLAARTAGLARLTADRAPALLIPRCRSVHTFGMRFSIDVVFLALPRTEIGGRSEVLEVRASLRPRRLATCRRGPPSETRVGALELHAGSAAGLGIEPGRTVRVTAHGPPRQRARNRPGVRD